MLRLNTLPLPCVMLGITQDKAMEMFDCHATLRVLTYSYTPRLKTGEGYCNDHRVCHYFSVSTFPTTGLDSNRILYKLDMMSWMCYDHSLVCYGSVITALYVAARWSQLCMLRPGDHSLVCCGPVITAVLVHLFIAKIWHFLYGFLDKDSLLSQPFWYFSVSRSQLMRNLIEPGMWIEECLFTDW